MNIFKGLLLAVMATLVFVGCELETPDVSPQEGTWQTSARSYELYQDDVFQSGDTLSNDSTRWVFNNGGIGQIIERDTMVTNITWAYANDQVVLAPTEAGFTLVFDVLSFSDNAQTWLRTQTIGSTPPISRIETTYELVRIN